MAGYVHHFGGSSMEDPNTKVALFRYRIMAPLLDPDLKKGDRKAILQGLSKRTYQHPNTETDIMIQAETIRHWYKQYKKAGFSGLQPKSREDKGLSRSIPIDLVDTAIQLKLEHPRRTLDGIIQLLEKAGKAEKGQIKRSTLHRIFQARNINIRTVKKTEAFGRFEAEFTNDRWQSDMMFGPWLPDPERPGKKFQAILIAFLDDHSRLIVHGQFYRHQSVECLEDVLKKAIQKRGVPKVIYVDNGKAYRSSHLASICAHLGIRLNFTEPYSPEGKGKIEKFWSFVRSSFLPEVDVAQILEMDQLNQSFQAWLEVFYHQKIHSETQETPMQRFVRQPDRIRRPEPDVFQKAFLYEEKRWITKACTFSLKNRDYEPKLHR
jgi:transposase InsO family protein